MIIRFPPLANLNLRPRISRPRVYLRWLEHKVRYPLRHLPDWAVAGIGLALMASMFILVTMSLLGLEVVR